jgi:hypothetical protein
VYVCQWRKQPLEKVEWEIQADGKHLDWDTHNIKEHNPMEKIKFDDNKNLGDIFFNKKLPLHQGTCQAIR